MTPLWPQALCVALGSALGGLLRWFVGLGLNGLPTWFPLGTLAVNAGGGFAIGLAGAWFAHRPDELLRLLLVTGLLGGFTTFSAFSGESLALLQRGAWGPALLHVTAHVLGGVACAALGWSLGQSAWPAR
jgi:CrcB protein